MRSFFLVSLCFLVVGLVAPGCGGSSGPPKPLPELYEPCENECAAGRCAWVGATSPTSTACLSTCRDHSDCPPTKQGDATLCLNQLCRPVACNGQIGRTEPPFACDDGILRPCAEIASTSCLLCPCGAAQFCDESTGSCRQMKQDGQPCTESRECPSGNCGWLPLSDGSDLLDGKSYCLLPIGTPCWEGDACYCRNGSCTRSCNDVLDCPASVGRACTTNGCRVLCFEQNCGESATCENISTVTQPVYTCTATGPRPPRAEGVPCHTDPECISGTCCPPAGADTWGHCAGDAGC